MSRWLRPGVEYVKGMWQNMPMDRHQHLPMVIGHEFSAIVTQAHPSVAADFKGGDRVSIEPIRGDGDCHMCIQGRENNCERLSILGLTQTGGMIERLSVPARKCHKLEPSISLQVGALVEPLSVAWQGVVNSKHILDNHLNASVVIIGTGMIGIATALCLRAVGKFRVLMIGRSAARNKMVQSLSLADVVVDFNDTSLSEKLENYFQGCPCCIFDTANSQSTFDLGIDLLRKGGMYYTFGQFHSKVSVDMNKIISKAIVVTGDGCYRSGTFASVIEAISQGLISTKTLERLVTRRIALGEVEDRGLKELMENKDQHIKILVRVNGDTLE
ncbi:hypothetical protein AYO21_10023 [Fonsecaea monophora]|uniref:Enoyl reductase (ER) domain-containing protein n=1 Tax=Fonsecaea monophora TaxID=254056 RepID=A0A177EXV6_9EURO|nr:hypothetical protein AYO21_10023 [Fonsecaea monophora]OAG35789.1 hypothetical protein AYO21_10023 [Fonsecaea monophora]